MTIPILKIVSVIVVLSMMVLVLLSMNHFLRGDFTSHQDDIDELRNEVKERSSVISDHSAFKELVQLRKKRKPNQSF